MTPMIGVPESDEYALLYIIVGHTEQHIVVLADRYGIR